MIKKILFFLLLLGGMCQLTAAHNFNANNNAKNNKSSRLFTLDSFTFADNGTDITITVNGSTIATTYQLYIDTDNNPATGDVANGGADFKIENDYVTRYSGGVWVWEWHEGNLVINDTPSVSREFKIARHYLPLLTSGLQINVSFTNIDGTFTPIDDPLPLSGMESYTTTTSSNLVSLDISDDLNLNIQVNGSGISATYQLFIDSDNNTGTGYSDGGDIVGADLLIENDNVNRFTGGAWVWEWHAGNLVINDIPGISREFQIERNYLPQTASGGVVNVYFRNIDASYAQIGGPLPSSGMQAYTTTTAATTTNWTGSVSSVWDLAGNWDNGIPTTASTVTIPDVTNAPEIATGTEANVGNLTITETDGVTINSSGTLIVSGTASGNVTYKRALATTNWYLVSSPVTGEDMLGMIANNNFAQNASMEIGFAPYDNSQIAVSDRWSYYNTAASVPLEDGKGYSTKLLTSGDISFTGTLNTESVSIALTQGAGDNFNLLGNPYTSFIDSYSFLTSNTNELTQQEIYIWNQATSSYDTKVAVDLFKVAPGQGFFVEANSTNNVTFAEDIQSHESSDTFQKSSRPEVRIFMSDGTVNRYAKIYYLNNATTGFDNGSDGKLFSGIEQSFAIYSHLISNSDGKNYQIQSLPNSNYENMIVPIGINANSGKEITFSVESLNLPENISVFLEDRLNGKFINLSENTYKTTLATASNGIGQFYLHTTSQKLSTDDLIESLTDISVYKSAKQEITITGLQANTKVALFSILGKKSFATTITSNGISKVALPHLADGVYIVKLSSEYGEVTRKIILD